MVGNPLGRKDSRLVVVVRSLRRRHQTGDGRIADADVTALVDHGDLGIAIANDVPVHIVGFPATGSPTSF